MNQRIIYVLISAGVLMSQSCGTGLRTPGTVKNCNSSLTFDKDIKSIVSSSGTGRCGSCHAGTYDNKSGIENNRSKVYQDVNNGRMPQGDSGFKDTADGKKFLEWAACVPLN